jgi:flagellar hook assembly protein FlgD
MLSNSTITVDIINLNGKRIRRLFSGETTSGNHTFTWNGIDDSRNKVASGVYYIKASGKLTEEWKPITYLK